MLDFGIARLADAAQTSFSIIGTPNYMAPEQIRGEQLDARCDLFAAGVVLFELIWYRRPFIADNVQALQYRILFEAQLPLSSLAPGIPHSLEQLVDRCLEKQPGRRPQSAVELLEMLRDARHSLTSEQTSITALPYDGPTHIAPDSSKRGGTPGGSRGGTPRGTPRGTPSRSGASAKRLAELRARQIDKLRDEARHALTDGRAEDALEAAERALMLDEDDAAAIELAELARKSVERREASAALADAKRLLDVSAIEPARLALGRVRELWATLAELPDLEGRLDRLERERAAASAAAASIAAAGAAAGSAGGATITGRDAPPAEVSPATPAPAAPTPAPPLTPPRAAAPPPAQTLAGAPGPLAARPAADHELRLARRAAAEDARHGRGGGSRAHRRDCPSGRWTSADPPDGHRRRRRGARPVVRRRRGLLLRPPARALARADPRHDHGPGDHGRSAHGHRDRGRGPRRHGPGEARQRVRHRHHARAVSPPPPPEPPPPPAGLVAVTIDAHPWARVAITPVGSTPPTKVGTLITPVSLDLAPGEYELTLENGGVTRTLSRRIKIAAGAPSAFRFPMPGFTPSEVVDQLMGSVTR